MLNIKKALNSIGFGITRIGCHFGGHFIEVNEQTKYDQSLYNFCNVVYKQLEHGKSIVKDSSGNIGVVGSKGLILLKESNENPTYKNVLDLYDKIYKQIGFVFCLEDFTFSSHKFSYNNCKWKKDIIKNNDGIYLLKPNYYSKIGGLYFNNEEELNVYLKTAKL